LGKHKKHFASYSLAGILFFLNISTEANDNFVFKHKDDIPEQDYHCPTNTIENRGIAGLTAHTMTTNSLQSNYFEDYSFYVLNFSSFNTTFMKLDKFEVETPSNLQKMQKEFIIHHK